MGTGEFVVGANGIELALTTPGWKGDLVEGYGWRKFLRLEC